MTDPQRILIIDQKNKVSQHLARFLSRLSFHTEEAISLEEASNKLLKANNFIMAIIHANPLESHTIKIIDNIKSFNPQLGILLLSKIENPDQAISLLQNDTIDQVARAGGTCIALGAGRVILIDKPEVLKAADRKKIAVVGVG